MSRGQTTPTAAAGPTFDPALPPSKLLDELAEKQANAMPGDKEAINSAQLRRFFSELKDLSRQFEARAAGKQPDEAEKIYKADFEPRFKMIRSKVAYAGRPGGQAKIPPAFMTFLDSGVKKVQDHAQFRLFIKHVEAVVGFMYGKGKVS